MLFLEREADLEYRVGATQHAALSEAQVGCCTTGSQPCRAEAGEPFHTDQQARICKTKICPHVSKRENNLEGQYSNAYFVKPYFRGESIGPVPKSQPSLEDKDLSSLFQQTASRLQEVLCIPRLMILPRPVSQNHLAFLKYGTSRAKVHIADRGSHQSSCPLLRFFVLIAQAHWLWSDFSSPCPALNDSPTP